MGLKPEKRAFYLAGVVTLWVFVICRVALPTAWKSLTVPISVVANILSFLLGHLAIHKRLVRIPEARTSHTLWRRAKKKSWHFLPTPRRILRYTQDRVARYGAPYLLFGIFCALHYTIPYFMWSPSASKGHENLAMYLRFVGFLLCVLLMLHENWYEKLKPYLPLFWYVTLLYCIPFVSTMMVLVTNGSTEWLINFALNLVFLIVLVDWVSFLLLSILGSLLGMLMYYLVVGPISLSGFSLPLGHLVAYQGVFFILLGLLFARKKQVTIHQRTRKLVRRTQDQASQLQVATDTHAQLANSLDPQSSVISEMRQATDRLRKGVGNKEDIDRIESALTHLEEIKIKSTRYLPLDPRKESLNEILDMVAKELEILGMENMPKLYCRHSQDRVVCDAAYITKLMVHSIQHVVRYHPGQAVYCYLDDAIIDYGTSKHTKQSLPCYHFTVSNQPQKKPQKQKYGIKNLKLIFGKDKKYLEENEQITQAHYGTMLFHQVGDECTQFYILPYDLNRVRPKITRFADENLQEETQLDAPEDRQFLDLVRKKGLPIQPIEKALLDCKHYHRRDVRKSGEPYYLHPVRAATELLKYTTELDMIIAELLHDTLEDTPYTVHQIASRYGKRVAHLVAEVTNLYSEKARKVKLKKKEKFTKMLEKAEKGPMTIKLFDRLDNLRTIHGHPSRQKRIQIATETLAFFLPIARILGLQPVEKELVELAQQVLDKNKSA